MKPLKTAYAAEMISDALKQQREANQRIGKIWYEMQPELNDFYKKVLERAQSEATVFIESTPDGCEIVDVFRKPEKD
jgi:hypothetical protein